MYKVYKYQLKEIWIQKIWTEAKNKKEALEKIKKGEYIVINNELRYSHTMKTRLKEKDLKEVK